MTATDSPTATTSPIPEVALEVVTQIDDAPGLGILPTISQHLAGRAQLFHLDAQPIEALDDLISRQYLYGSNATFVKWTAKKGGVVPLHHHINEQITWITQGRAEVHSQGRKYTMNAGDILVIPPTVPHEFVFLEDSIDSDIFAPGRQDWIDGTASYYHDEK